MAVGRGVADVSIADAALDACNSQDDVRPKLSGRAKHKPRECTEAQNC